MFFNILTYYFVAKLIGTAGAKYPEPYGGDYFSFVLIGIAFSGCLMVSLRGFSESVRNEQMMGTLEAMLVRPQRTPWRSSPSRPSGTSSSHPSGSSSTSS